MKPPKYIDLGKWFRKHCRYEVLRNTRGVKYHFFWLPQRAWARVWPFHSRLNDYPEREVSMKEVANGLWRKV